MTKSNNLAKRLDFLAHETIGVIGCGHLGKTIASELVRRGFPAQCLMLSRGRSHESLQGILDAGLEGCLSDNQEICRDCSIIFICIRPQSLPDLRGLAFPEDALVVSCMAGVS
ncbi:MAG: NAD(P)-binding domain-containing protein, partial [Methanothrix sp.]|nr:NAD(P)-binding domain-containing protein [Methanothrix sp.]